MQLPILLSENEISVINDSRARHDGIIVHPGYELSTLIAAATSEKLRPVLPRVRADRSERRQVGWRISTETDAKLVELATECDANKTEIVRGIILLQGDELEASARREASNAAYVAACEAQRTRPTDRFVIAALSANNREGNTIPVQQLANAILRAQADVVIISQWNPAAIGSSELREILKSYYYEILESRYRAEQNQNGFMVLFKDRYKYPCRVEGEVPGVFFPVSLKDVVAAGRYGLILIGIDSEKEEEARIADINNRFKGLDIIAVRGKNIIASSDSVSVEAIDDPELSEVQKAEIQYV